MNGASQLSCTYYEWWITCCSHVHDIETVCLYLPVFSMFIQFLHKSELRQLVWVPGQKW